MINNPEIGTHYDEESVLEVEDLTVTFAMGSPWRRKVLVPVNHVSFSLKKDEALGLVGESGSGKSSIAKALTRIYTPTSGEMYFHGTNVAFIRGSELRKYRQKVQMVFQDPYSALNPLKTVHQQVQRPLRLIGNTQYSVDSLLEAVGLSRDLQYKLPHELSGGQRQRVVIARAMALNPEIIVADEPISMLDVSIRASILSLMNDLRRRYHVGYLYITHDLASARFFSDRIMVMYGGHLVEIARSAELIRRPFHPYTQLLLAATPSKRQQKSALPQTGYSTPNLWSTAKGCPFAPRCLYVRGECTINRPPWTWVSSTHGVACFANELFRQPGSQM
ncbi:MAG: ABC transporter ATP-binding protein [Firmicutes bacterium]|nr:ABC transporter ATP-binding protein [Bacillota bacterium]